jgi:hypothetical protein
MHEAIPPFEGICLEGIVECDILGVDKFKRAIALGSSIIAKHVRMFHEGYLFVTNASGAHVFVFAKSAWVLIDGLMAAIVPKR